VFESSHSWELNNPLRRLFDRSPSKVVKLLGILKDWSVMDFGCGPGFYTIPFAKAAGKAVAVDLQPEMLAKTADYAKKARVDVTTVQSDGTHIPLPGDDFDLIFLSLVYHELPDKAAVLQELRRLIRPGGRIAIREKIAKAFFPIGPPISPVNEIESDLKTAGFEGINVHGTRGAGIVSGKKIDPR
jgi:ubiquinone/menaquinone biosynthesis C-methylase UbiE